MTLKQHRLSMHRVPQFSHEPPLDGLEQRTKFPRHPQCSANAGSEQADFFCKFQKTQIYNVTRYNISIRNHAANIDHNPRKYPGVVFEQLNGSLSRNNLSDVTEKVLATLSHCICA